MADEAQEAKDEGATAASGSKGSTKARKPKQAKAPKTRTPLDADMLRVRGAQVLWFVCLIAALFLAIGALTWALNANPQNPLVDFVRQGAGIADLGLFTLEDGIKKFEGRNAEVQNALFNWGLGAVFWLVLGRILDRVIRP